MLLGTLLLCRRSHGWTKKKVPYKLIFSSSFPSVKDGIFFLGNSFLKFKSRFCFVLTQKMDVIIYIHFFSLLNPFVTTFWITLNFKIF